MANMPMQPVQDAGIFSNIVQMLGMRGSQDAGQQLLPQQPEMVAPAQPNFAPQGSFDPAQVQQVQQAPEAPMDGILKGGMDESKQQRLLLLSAALMSPGGISDKLRLAALSQAAYTELQGEAGKNDLAKQVEADRLRMDSESNRTLRGAQTAESQQRTGESAVKVPLEIARIRMDTKKLEVEVDLAERRYKALQKIDPEGAKQAKLELDTAQEKLATQKAQTASANASAGEHGARTTGITQENDARGILASETSTSEAIARATTTLNKGKTGASAKKDNLNLMAEMYKKANPEATEQDAAQYALEADAGTKGETLRAATALYQNATDDATRKSAEEVLVALTRKNAGTKAAPGTSSNTPGDNAAWVKARNSVKQGQQYVGPDGKTYTRK